MMQHATKASDSPDLRRLITDLAALAVCTWTGYFLLHTWQGADAVRLGLLLTAAVASYGGAWSAGAGGRARLGWLAAAAGLGAAGAAGLCALVPAGALVLLGRVRRDATAWAVGPRLLAAGCLAGAAALLGGTGGLAVSPLLYAAPLTVYLAVALSLWSDRPVSRGGLTAAVGVMALTAGGVAGFAVGRAYALVAVLFAAWLAVRVGWFAWYALQDGTPGRVHRFAESAVAGAGLLAGALLALQVPAGRESMTELAPPVLLGAFSILLIRLRPVLGRHTSGDPFEL
jgi:hypothetical protein